MKKTKPFIIVAVVVIILAAVYFFVLKKRDDPNSTEGNTDKKDSDPGSNPTPKPTPDIWPLLPGSKNIYVGKVQGYLKHWVPELKVDNIWGEKTTAALLKAGYPLSIYAKDLISLAAGGKYVPTKKINPPGSVSGYHRQSGNI